MSEFEGRPPVSQSPCCSGVELRAEPAAILRACEELGPLFVLFRNEACIFGSIADPLWHLETANVHLAASGAITLNLAPRSRCSVFGYVEPGPRGGFIDAVEFCAGRSGFLKICRMEKTDRAGWRALLADFCVAPAAPARIAGIGRTNHLGGCACGSASPAGVVLDRFLDRAVECGATLHVTAQAPAARGRLVIRPTRRVRLGHWTLLSAGETALHLAPGCVSGLRVVTRPHLAQLILLGAGGRFLARILTRDAALLSELDEIL